MSGPKSDACPNGHKLPNYTPKGQCTPLYCTAETTEAPPDKPRKKKALQREDFKALGEGVVPEIHDAATALQAAKLDALERYGPAAGRELARKQFLKLPEGLSGGDAEEWADRRIVEMLPLAVAELEFQLRFGDDEQRAKAASKVLDATGRGKKENGAAAVAPIIMIQGGAMPPWLQRRDESNIIEVQPTLAKPDGKQ